MLIKKEMLHGIDLQLFAEGAGGDGGTGADGATTGVTASVSGSQTGVSKNPLSGVKYGVQEQTETSSDVADRNKDAVSRNETFEQLIKGEYKDLYDARVQDTIQKRLKSSKETVEKYEAEKTALAPLLDLLSRKHGVDASDIAGLVKAVEDDDSYYEDEAFEKGLSVEQLKEIKKLERENAEFRKQIESRKAESEAEKIYAGWMEQAEKAKLKYPSLNLAEEIKSPQFASLLKSGIDVETAYTVVHKDDIIPAAMQYTAKLTEQKLTNKILANGSRPVENGINSQASAVIKSDVSKLTKADRDEIARRVAMGEKIRF